MFETLNVQLQMTERVAFLPLYKITLSPL